MIPAILGPTEFGRFVVADLFARYLMIADLGLVLLLDRKIPPLVAVGDTIAADQITQHILWMRTIVGGLAGGAFIAAVLYLGFTGDLAVGIPAALFSGAYGTFALLTGGPVAAWRASSRYRALVLSSTLINIGLSVPRVIGAWLGGVAGCFLALALWFGLSAVVLQCNLPLRTSARPSFRDGFSLLAESLPLFAGWLGWALYLMANRSVYATIAGHAELGQFSFGASILMLLVTTASMAYAVYCPKLAGQVATAPPYTHSEKLLRDSAILTIGGGAFCLTAILLLPAATKAFYPQFIASVDVARILLISGPPYLVASLYTQLIIAVGRHPWTDAIAVFPASLLALAAGILAGHAAAGMPGAAAGSVAGTLLCPFLQLIILRRSEIVRTRHLITLILCVALTTGALAIAASLMH